MYNLRWSAAAYLYISQKGPLLSSNLLFVSQGQSGEVSYAINVEHSDPKDVASFFFINPTSGSLSVISNLRADDTKRTVYKVSRMLHQQSPSSL